LAAADKITPEPAEKQGPVSSGKLHYRMEQEFGPCADILKVCLLFEAVTPAGLARHENHSHVGHLGQDGRVVQGATRHPQGFDALPAGAGFDQLDQLL
jgi:hypothetical protein